MHANRRCEWQSRGRSALLATAAIVLACLGILHGLAADISYVYDDVGRLRAVIDPVSDTAVYAYDAVGNLTGITRQPSSTLAVLQFTPSSSPIGTTVTIYGTGFSATPASNTVKFNTTTATVLTASTTILTANVPAGATTGPISMTVGANTATSTASFTVGSGAPMLTSFNPAVGTYGATVTLTGTNYDTTSINNRVAFTAAMGAVATATSTSITVPVPSTAQTGSISVSTIQGKATSSQEFFVAPPGVVTTDVQYTGRITVDGPTVNASITTANKTGLMVFDGTAGQRIGLGFSAATITQFTVIVYRPDGVALNLPATFGLVGGSVDLPVLPMAGAYTIFLDPFSTYTGTVTVTASTELSGTITPGGAAVPISITRVGQNARYTFAGTAGQTVSAGLTAVTIPNGTVSIIKPDGSTLVGPISFNTSGGAIESQILPTTGTYAILVDPSGTATGTITLRLYNTPDVSGTITLNGAVVTPTLTVPGQRARYTFAGTAGQWVNLGLTAVTILNPSGTPLASTSINTSGGGLEPPNSLPTTGTYTIVIDPSGTNTGNITLKLMSYLAGTLNLNGTATTTTITQVGQNARYTFTGTAGQWVSLGMTGVTITASTVLLVRPDGTTWLSMSVGTTGNSLDSPTALPTTGTYAVIVNPIAQYTGTMTLTLSTDVTGTLTINAAATPVTLSRAGRNARYTFSGTAGQQVTVRITGNTLSSTTVNLYTPSGSYQTGTNSSAASFNLTPVTLATTGTYTVTVNPTGLTTGSLNLQVTSP